MCESRKPCVVCFWGPLGADGLFVWKMFQYYRLICSKHIYQQSLGQSFLFITYLMSLCSTAVRLHSNIIKIYILGKDDLR